MNSSPFIRDFFPQMTINPKFILRFEPTTFHFWDHYDIIIYKVQARIQEFKNGKRENGIKTRVVLVLSLSQKLDFQTDFYRQLFTYKVFW